MLAYLRGNLTDEGEEVGERNDANEDPTMGGYPPHHQLTLVEKEQTGN